MTEEQKKRFEIPAANWDLYYGNDTPKIPRPDIICGGAISFKQCLGKPLSQELWEDLIHRLQITGLSVYKWDSSQWCVGRSKGYCIINLNKEGLVNDIKIF